MITIFWYRRDLRNHDNHGLFQALKENENVLPVFIFDSDILHKLEDKDDARVTFIHNEIAKLKLKYQALNSDLKVYYGKPFEIFKELTNTYSIKNVYTNYDYESYGVYRDKEICNYLNIKNISFHSFKDHTLLDKNEVLKDDGSPYTIFTPYMKKYRSILNETHYQNYDTSQYFNNLYKTEKSDLISLVDMSFTKSSISVDPFIFNETIVENYENTRDFPHIKGTSKVSVHLRFGTISIREIFRNCLDTPDNFRYTNELIWRDFYMMILFHFPEVETKEFKPKYDNIKWINDEEQFYLWTQGKTGYPLVDAGIRELNATGFMHNRVRMVVASFLCKHLLIDWRWGEAYFARKLLDFELSSNNGGWQWAAGSGCDAAPYFRVFNPELQRQKFDPKNQYIKQWIEEIDQIGNYPKPIVEHKFARDRAIKTYKEALDN